ncbi:MAG: alanine:cation symporter family protein, partial [Proteobacteria bacterium]|nr:alanine:cation symporter family protein [Pseudomonadota bacterium]
MNIKIRKSCIHSCPAATTIQSNSIALALKTQLGITPWITGIGLALLTWLVIIGGIRSIARVTEW